MGFPDKVPAWYISPRGETISMISFLAPYAPTGKPPPITFPKQVISALIANSSCAPPNFDLKPVITSSITSKIPFSLVMALNSLINSGLGKTTPIFPAIGSINTAAISECFSICAFTLSILLYSAIKVFFTASSGTPLLPGILNVAIPDPAATNRASVCP